MRFTKDKKEESRLGITPLIDIVFLLLIFFVLTSHFHVASGLPISLPKIAQKAYDGDRQNITLVIDRNGGVYFKGNKMGLDKIASELRNAVEKDGVIHLLLEADKEVKHGRVVEIMDLAKNAGVSSIIIAARWEPKGAN
ncbi:MAG: biopolymer transporter ExbD [Deltaproteobacteria bacterium]|nr:biopolymer transporter ExbD [Deltaproteobacteria bacterium]